MLGPTQKQIRESVEIQWIVMNRHYDQCVECGAYDRDWLLGARDFGCDEFLDLKDACVYTIEKYVHAYALSNVTRAFLTELFSRLGFIA